ncbi:MAG: hypothetical protein M3N21_02435 [Actinomycetota bacterium]|nr:hypothetical protein [Actinomycetota bacterium]
MSVRLIRTAAVIGILGVVGSTGLADARPKPKPKAIPPVCNLVSDPAPDGHQFYAGNVDSHLNPVPTTGQDDTMDVVTADLATDAKNLTTVIRMRKAARSSSSSPTGIQWQFNFNADGYQLFTAVTSDPVNGLQGTFGYFDKTVGGYSIAGKATAVVDPATNEVRVTVPLATLNSPTGTAGGAGAAIKSGTKFDTMIASAGGAVIINSPGGPISGTLLTNGMPSGEVDTSDKTYVGGSPSCVVVGK